MKKFALKTEGLTGAELDFALKLNAKFAEMPDNLTKEDISAEIKIMFKSLFNDKGEPDVSFISDINALKAMMDETKEGSIKSILKTQGDKINELLAQGKTGKGKSMEDVYLEHKDAIGKVFNRSQGGEVTISLKEVTSIGASTSSSGVPANPYFPLPTDSGVFVDVRKPRLFILNYVDVGATNDPSIMWTEEGTFNLGAAIVTEGTLKPSDTQTAIRRISQYKKVADTLTITEELQKDLPRLYTNFKRLFNDKVDRKYQYQVLGDIIAIAPAYASTPLNGTVANVDNYGAIAAALVQCQLLNFFPDSLFLNPADLWSMNLIKGTNGQYVIPPFVTISLNGMVYGNLKLEVSTQVIAGNFLLGEAKTFKVEVYEDYTLRIGWMNDDFGKNQFTAVGEIKFHDYIATNEIGGWCYGNFTTVKALLEAA